jgi:hypothetical protein
LPSPPSSPPSGAICAMSPPSSETAGSSFNQTLPPILIVQSLTENGISSEMRHRSERTMFNVLQVG